MRDKQPNIENRLTYLAEKFDVFDVSEGLDEIKENYESSGYEDIVEITDPITNNIIALISDKPKSDGHWRMVRRCSIELTVLSGMISADPTNNKSYLQWLLSVYSSLLKTDKIDEAIRFACEDLPVAKQYLELFEQHKRKDKFIKLCSKNYNLSEINDHSNINQYKSLSKLYDAVDPFIEKDYSGLKGNIMRYVNINEAEIAYKSRHFMVYIPKTRNAMIIFDSFTSWCTAKPENGMFKHYKSTNLKPNGKESTLYVVIPTSFFEGTTDDLYHLHFDTNQFHNRSNSDVDPIPIMSCDPKIISYFANEIRNTMLSGALTNSIKTKYLTQASKFGVNYLIFDVLGDEIDNIRLINKTLNALPDSVGRFKNLVNLALVNNSIYTIDRNVGSLNNLKVLSLNKNPIAILPEEIGNMTRLEYLSIRDTNIVDLPDSITKLDLSNGGSLRYISISDRTLIDKIKNKLPNCEIIID
jgi:hypothetical protein